MGVSTRADDVSKRRGTFFTNQNQQYVTFNIGDGTYGKPTILFSDTGGKLRIGKFCSIADDVTIFLGGEHRVDWVTTYPFNVIYQESVNISGHPHSKGDVIIGNDVWVGAGSTILSGVTIGNGAIIGAKSVVTKNVAAYAVFAGNPAKFIRFRFTEAQIAALERIAWWNWPLSNILDASSILLQNDIDAFIEVYDHTDRGHSD